MVNRKLIVKISYGLNALLIVTVVVILVYQQRLIRQIADSEQQAPQVAAISDSITLADNSTKPFPLEEGGREQLATEVESLRYQLEASEEELDMAREDLENARSGGLPDMAEFAAEQKKMMENPAVRNMERRIQENMINRFYGSLFEMLGLSDEKIQAFKTLMVDNQVEMQEVSLEMMSQSVPEEERRAKFQQFEDQQKAELEKQMKDLLGEDNFEKYDAYGRRLFEQQLVTNFINPDLSDEKEQALIDVLYEARKDVEAEYGFDSLDSEGFRYGISSDSPEEDRDRQVIMFDRYMESARGVLPESQAEQFESIIKGIQESLTILAEGLLSPSEDSGDEL